MNPTSQIIKELLFVLSSSNIVPAWSLLAKRARIESNAICSSGTELLNYLNTDLTNFSTRYEVENLDILAWWKKYEKIFPAFSVMAGDLLTPQVSTISLGFAFRPDNGELDQRRTRFTPKLLECHMGMKD